MGFHDFILILSSEKGHTNYHPLHALLERWSKSTQNFHHLFGEFTLDPISFPAVTGIAYAGDFAPLDASLHHMMPDRVAYIHTHLDGPGHEGDPHLQG